MTLMMVVSPLSGLFRARKDVRKFAGNLITDEQAQELLNSGNIIYSTDPKIGQSPPPSQLASVSTPSSDAYREKMIRLQDLAKRKGWDFGKGW